MPGSCRFLLNRANNHLPCRRPLSPLPLSFTLFPTDPEMEKLVEIRAHPALPLR